jgi:hypothetical protein
MNRGGGGWGGRGSDKKSKSGPSEGSEQRKRLKRHLHRQKQRGEEDDDGQGDIGDGQGDVADGQGDVEGVYVNVFTSVFSRRVVSRSFLDSTVEGGNSRLNSPNCVLQQFFLSSSWVFYWCHSISLWYYY